MNDLPIHVQRLAALQKAIQRKQQFDSIDEMRKIKRMTVLSYLIEFECATAKTLLDLLEQRNNAILTSMVKDHLIKIHRWQNSQVYVPTEVGKKWLLQNLDDEQEIERVSDTPIKRKISGYSAEHDLLVQRAAIIWARDNARPGEQWRLFKPRRIEKGGKVADALIVFSRGGESRRVYVEVERTAKQPVELICAFLRTARNMQIDESTVILCTKQKIELDYMSCLFALQELRMSAPVCEMMPGTIARYGLTAGENRFIFGEFERIDVEMVDEDGQPGGDALGLVDVLFSPVFWMLALRQYDQDWHSWVSRAAYAIVRLDLPPPVPRRRSILDDELDLDLDDDDEEQEQWASESEIKLAARQLAAALIESIEGPAGDDNPMRSAGDLQRARERWRMRFTGRCADPAAAQAHRQTADVTFAHRADA